MSTGKKKQKKDTKKLQQKLRRWYIDSSKYRYPLALFLIVLGFVFIIGYPTLKGHENNFPNTPIGKSKAVPDTNDKIALVSKVYDSKNNRLALIFNRNNGSGEVDPNTTLHFNTDEITSNKYHVEGFQISANSYTVLYSNVPEDFKTFFVRISNTDDKNLINKDDPFSGTDENTNGQKKNSQPVRIFVNNDKKLKRQTLTSNWIKNQGVMAETYNQKVKKNQIKKAQNNIKDGDKYIAKQNDKISQYNQDLKYSTGEQKDSIKSQIDDANGNISDQKINQKTLKKEIASAQKQNKLSKIQQSDMTSGNYHFDKIKVGKINSSK